MSKRAVILAGGLGSRLRPFTEIIPKPLLPVGEKAILEIQIEHLKKHHFKEIFIATNYKSEYIENFFGDGRRYGVRIIISKECKPLGTVGPLKLLQDRLDEPFLVMNGDILTLMNFAEFYDFGFKNNALLTVTVKKIVTPFAFGNIFFKGDHVSAIEEKPNIVTYALAGIYMMTPKIFDLIPENEYYGMDSLIKKMLEYKLDVIKYEIDDYWIDIGRIEDYSEVQDAYQKHFKDK